MLPSKPQVSLLLDDLSLKLLALFNLKLIGFYVYGSFVWGDFDPQISDLDMLAVLADDLTDAEATQLRTLHDQFVYEHPEWTDRIEVQYVGRERLQTFRTHSYPMGVISPGEPFHVIEGDRAWLMNWYFARTYGVKILGLPPEEVIPSITDEEFRDAIRDHAAAWETYILHAKDHPSYRSYAVLTLTRALCSLALGEQVSKRMAVEWARENVPPNWIPLIERAYQARSDAAVRDSILYEEAAAYVVYARERIAAHDGSLFNRV